MHRLPHFACAAAWLALSACAAVHGQNQPQAAAQSHPQPQTAAPRATGSPYRGVVTFGGLPLPGAAITMTQGTNTETAISDERGAFEFDNLANGKWTIEIQMQTFATIHGEVTIAPD